MDNIDLPPELLQSIFDHFAGWEEESDVDSSPPLLACALTCRQWREPAQCALFSHLTLSLPNTFASLFSALTASPRLAPSIKHLRIITIPPQSNQIWLHDVPSADRAAQIIRLLTNVSSVQLGCKIHTAIDPRWTHISHRMREALVQLLASPTLTTLTIRNWNFDIPAAHYLNIALASPSLRHLSFVPSLSLASTVITSLPHTKDDDDDDHSSDLSETRCRARFAALAPTLTLFIVDRNAEVRLASSGGGTAAGVDAPGHELYALRDLDEAFEAPFLHVLGDLILPHVLELQVVAETGHGPPTLSAFSRLAVIDIDYSREADIGTQTHAALTLLRTLPAPALLRVLKLTFDTITVLEGTPRGQERFAWLEIVQMLASKHFPNLARLEIGWTMPRSDESDESDEESSESDSVDVLLYQCGEAELGLHRIREAGIEVYVESVSDVVF